MSRPSLAAESVYVRPFDGAGEAIQISTSGGITPRWRRDGRELYYLAPGGNMMAVAVQDGAGFHVGNPAHLFHVEVARDDFGQYRRLRRWPAVPGEHRVPAPRRRR